MQSLKTTFEENSMISRARMIDTTAQHKMLKSLEKSVYKPEFMHMSDTRFLEIKNPDERTMTHCVTHSIVTELLFNRYTNQKSQGMQTVGGFIDVNPDDSADIIINAIKTAKDHLPPLYRKNAVVMISPDTEKLIANYSAGSKLFINQENIEISNTDTSTLFGMQVFIDNSLINSNIIAVVIDVDKAIIVDNDSQWDSESDILLMRFEIMNPAAIRFVKKNYY